MGAGNICFQPRGILWEFKATWVKGNVLGRLETKNQTGLSSEIEKMSPP
jgi:hypothetical protein